MKNTRDCLASLAAVAYDAVDVIVVTNGQEDFDEQMARAACPAITVVASARNLGYAGGCNLGAAAALERGARLLAFLNNDTAVEPDLFDAIVAAFDADPRVGVCGTVVTYADDPGRIWFAGGRLNRTFGYTRHIGFRSRAMPAAGRAVDFVSGCALVVRGDVFTAAGGLDASYFHYFEDTDLCARAERLGYTSYVVAAPSVRHRVSAAAGDGNGDRMNRLQGYYFARNRLLFVRRNGRGWRRVTALLAQPVLTAYECAGAIATGNWTEARGRVEGLIDGARGRDGRREFGAA
jgi:GT2 family glycosyltransferase